jgi:triosephosphate isomerase (TIM)
MNAIPSGALSSDSPFRSTDNCTVLVFPSFLDIDVCKEAGLDVGAQCGRSEASGAFTGDVSIEMLQKKGCTSILCGHSERRLYHHETDEMIACQVKEAVQYGITPILCIGETEEEKKAGRTEEVLHKQVQHVSTLNHHDGSRFMIAYEPVWAIGTGMLPSPEECQNIHAFIRSMISDPSTPILYGGSLKSSNAPAFFSQKDIDGGLIGGSALDCAEFLKIREEAR